MLLCRVLRNRHLKSSSKKALPPTQWRNLLLTQKSRMYQFDGVTRCIDSDGFHEQCVESKIPVLFENDYKTFEIIQNT